MVVADIAVVEDTKSERELLQGFVEQYCREKGLELQLELFEDGASFLERYPAALDVVLLDIEMPGLSGLDTARRLREFDKTVQILFISYLVQYAIEGYLVDAADFLPKPVAYPTFSSRMDRVMGKLRFYAPRFLMTSYAKEPISCQIQQISYIESLNKKTILHLADGREYFSSEPLYALEEKLRGEAFFRCHNAFLVNLGHVCTVGANDLTVPGHSIPVSKYRKKEFLQKLAACRGRML